VGITKKATRAITPQDWENIEKELENFYRTVKLLIDGYVVTLRLTRISVNKNAIMLYINGGFNTRWIIEDCEERRRFIRPVKRTLLTPKKKAELKLSKKRLRELEDKCKFTSYASYWPSFKPLRRHLLRNNQVIEIEEENDDEV